MHAILSDVIVRCTKIMQDPKAAARHVLNNNTKILNLLREAIGYAEDSTKVLAKAFRPSESAQGGPPRIACV